MTDNPSEPVSSSRPKNKSLHVRIPPRLLKDVKILLLDPVTGRSKYGAVNKLVARLLSEWVEEQRREKEDE